MITANRSRPVREQAAAGETDRLFYEVRQTLRLTGLPSEFRSFGSRPHWLAALWEGMRANVETRAFEEIADRLREEAVHAADGMGRLSVLGRAELGESQAFQAESALMTHHYANAKRLAFAASLATALEGRDSRGGHRAGSSELIERGAPLKMPPMELVDEFTLDDATRRVFRDIKRTLELEKVSDDFQAMALWPRYAVAGWQRLKPTVKTEGYRTTCLRLGQVARELARSLPYPVSISLDALGRDGEDTDAILAEVLSVERALPKLTLNVALLTLDWQAPERARRSPFPAKPRVGGENN